MCINSAVSLHCDLLSLPHSSVSWCNYRRKLVLITVLCHPVITSTRLAGVLMAASQYIVFISNSNTLDIGICVNFKYP